MRRHLNLTLTGAASLALILSVSVVTAQSQGGKVSAADKSFVQKATEGGLAEVQLGQMAAEKASNTNVKRFGQKMVDDHTELNHQMKPVASEIGVPPTTQLSPKDQALKQKLKGLTGAAFDKAYMKAMVKAHTKTLAEFKKEASHGKSLAVKQAAQQGAVVIHGHLELAKKIASAVGALPGGKESNVSTEIQ